MRMTKIITLSVATLAAVLATAAPAEARPHQHKVCHMERHHGHAKRVCHWVR